MDGGIPCRIIGGDRIGISGGGGEARVGIGGAGRRRYLGAVSVYIVSRHAHVVGGSAPGEIDF